MCIVLIIYNILLEKKVNVETRGKAALELLQKHKETSSSSEEDEDLPLKRLRVASSPENKQEDQVTVLKDTIAKLEEEKRAWQVEKKSLLKKNLLLQEG